MVNHATSGALDIGWDAGQYHVERVVIVGESDIEWNAELHPCHVEGSLMAGEPEEDSYAEAPTVVDLVDLSSSDSNTCCMLEYFDRPTFEITVMVTVMVIVPNPPELLVLMTMDITMAQFRRNPTT